MIAASKCHQKQHSIRYKFGLHISHDYKDALVIDKANNNIYWQTAIKLELDNIAAHRTFRDIGFGTPLPVGIITSVSTLSSMSRKMVIAKLDLLLVAISLLFPMNLSTPVSLLYAVYALQSSLVK